MRTTHASIVFFQEDETNGDLFTTTLEIKSERQMSPEQLMQIKNQGEQLLGNVVLSRFIPIPPCKEQTDGLEPRNN